MVDRSSTIEATSSFVHQLGMVIRNMRYRSCCIHRIEPSLGLQPPPPQAGRLHGKRLTEAVAAAGLLEVVVGVRRADRVCAHVGLGPLVALCTQCKTRWSTQALTQSFPSSLADNSAPEHAGVNMDGASRRCICCNHVVFTFLAGALTQSEVQHGVVYGPNEEKFDIVRMKDVLRLDSTVTSLLRTHSLAQTGSLWERVHRLGRALLAMDQRPVFGRSTSGGRSYPLVDVKLCTDGATILVDGRQITTTSFVVMAEAGGGQSTEHHHVLVRGCLVDVLPSSDTTPRRQCTTVQTSMIGCIQASRDCAVNCTN